MELRELFAKSFKDCSISLKKKTHFEFMKGKKHTSHCIINRYLEYFVESLSIWELDKCKRSYGCEFVGWLFLSEKEYNQECKKECRYFHHNYEQFVEKLNADRHVIEVFEDY